MSGRMLTGFAASLFVGLSVAMPASVAQAGELPYTQAQFESAQRAGKPILIHITASWCSVCQVQKSIIGRLLGEPKFRPYVLFDVDFDTQKDLVRKLGARAQSTFIVYKGKTREASSSGDTRPNAITLMLDKGLGA